MLDSKGKYLPILIKPFGFVANVTSIPALFAFHHTPADVLKFSFTIPLLGPVLSLAVDKGSCSFWVSVENADVLIQRFEIGGSTLDEWGNMDTTKVDAACAQINDETLYTGVRLGTNGEEGGDPADLKARLYTVEALRKVNHRGGYKGEYDPVQEGATSKGQEEEEEEEE